MASREEKENNESLENMKRRIDQKNQYKMELHQQIRAKEAIKNQERQEKIGKIEQEVRKVQN